MVSGRIRSLRRGLEPRPRASGDAPEAGLDYYGGVVIGAQTIGARACSATVAREVLETLALLEPDDYLRYVRDFVAEGRRVAGESWRYADIVTALAAATELLRPSSYLELGVRRGRSMAVVAARSPECRIVGIDLWDPGYAGMENPGPEAVRAELEKVGFRGDLELITGDSHAVLPDLFREHPDLTFDLVTVDGDHSPAGAARDLRDVLPRLRVGGALVFDDIRHVAHPELHSVWERTVVLQRRYATWEFGDVGYGVAVAVRRW